MSLEMLLAIQKKRSLSIYKELTQIFFIGLKYLWQVIGKSDGHRKTDLQNGTAAL
jgi:hypothetical protein